ncbi:methyltransferase domain-containing protein [Myxococcota bacterium]|nr:methyltransferase domain-containing protein [Myxococcota bacterium]
MAEGPQVVESLHPLLHGLPVPAPTAILALAPLRRRLRDELLQRERARLARLAGAWEVDRASARAELAALGDRLLDEHRHQAWARAARGSGVERLAAAVDRRLFRQGAELMDDPSVDARVRGRIVSDLARVNDLIGSYWSLLRAAGPSLGPGPTTVLDLASGHGGLALWLLRQGPRRGLQLQVTATDLRDDYLDPARQRAARAGLPLQTMALDALAMDLAPRSYDVVTCTQAIHHFSPGQVAVLLAEARRVARRSVVFTDGLRSTRQLGLACALFVGMGSHPASVHDCAVSVRRMFVPEELDLLAALAPGGPGAHARFVAPAFVGLLAPAAA